MLPADMRTVEAKAYCRAAPRRLSGASTESRPRHTYDCAERELRRIPLSVQPSRRLWTLALPMSTSAH